MHIHNYTANYKNITDNKDEKLDIKFCRKILKKEII